MNISEEKSILGIETSCDETAASVVRNGTRILSSLVSSQIHIHKDYGGVVPELASRHQLENIDIVVTEAMERSRMDFHQLSAVAVTYGPGLVGSLLVGIAVAKSISYVYRVPLIAINHLEAHIRSPFIENPDIDFPAVALVVSGGHTSLFLVPEEGVYMTLARTRDDAAGEAFDKVAKLLGLGYPGGPIIDELSRRGDPDRIRFPKARMTDMTLDFSFSGLKTAVLRYVQAEGIKPVFKGDASEEGKRTDHRESIDKKVFDLLASFQKAVVDALVDKTFFAAKKEKVKSIVVSGGVACNSCLRKRFREEGELSGWKVYIPSQELTTDNAAMVASAAFLKLERRQFADLALNAEPDLRL
ncbi:MAG: tRNA (adenosine(37)-N6)-threonylcarbamoyltransferase complex transferase subunit TsaD [Acidobacteriota bacterium]